MNPALLQQLERISSAGIQLLPVPQISTHFVFERHGCVVLVERRGEGFGAVGSPGMLSDKGFGALVERAGSVYFVWKGEERKAAPEEAQAARRLFTDLREILR
jgi:hypothetical protein